MKKFKLLLIAGAFFLALAFSYKAIRNFNPNPAHRVGDKLDSLHGVYVYYNGGVGNVTERNRAKGGYNLGLKYQCVEFVKRYYYEHYKHKMPDSYGHAKDFFDPAVGDGCLSKKRDLLQYTNPGKARPRMGDLLVFDGSAVNPYGHVAIVSKVFDAEIELIQQNPGPFAPSRERLSYRRKDGMYLVGGARLLGWLRLK